MDYCTLWFEGWWQHCCKAHDDAYTAQIPRHLADGNLLACVMDSAPTESLALVAPIVAVGMYSAVRLFGRYFYNRARSTQSDPTSIERNV